MDYAVKIDTAHSVYTRAAPKLTTLQMSRGRLAGGWIYFPSGPAGLLHLIILRAKFQITPVNQHQSYALDDVMVPLHLGIDLDQPPYQITILTWNDSTQYDHTLTLSLTLDPFFGRPPRRPFLTSLFRSKPNDAQLVNGDEEV